MKTFSPVARKFVLHWGEMGTRWGINRTVAQIHALLYISGEPMDAGGIVEALSIARSNVSTSLKELQGWGVIRTVHVLGDRKDYFESMHDVWEMFRVILDQRIKREIDPTIELLRECLEETGEKRAADHEIRHRLSELLEFFQSMHGWYSQIRRLSTQSVIRFVRLGDKVGRWIGAVG
jgi:DNA-binding transcriptional regulator GbsR (MarR family)